MKDWFWATVSNFRWAGKHFPGVHCASSNTYLSFCVLSMIDRTAECSQNRLYYCVPELCEQYTFNDTIQMLLRWVPFEDLLTSVYLTNTDHSYKLIFFIIVADDLPKMVMFSSFFPSISFIGLDFWINSSMSNYLNKALVRHKQCFFVSVFPCGKHTSFLTIP